MTSRFRLSGQQVAQLRDAIVAGFDRNDLRTMTRIELDAELEAIAGGETLSDLAMSLIDWAEDTGRVYELIAAMQRSNPTSPQVQALAQAAAGWQRPTSSPQVRVSPAAPAPSSAGRRWHPLPMIGALLLVGLLVFGAVAAIRMLGNQGSAAPVGSSTATPIATAPPTGAVQHDDSVQATALPTPIADATVASGQIQPLLVDTPDQEWRLGTRLYRILSAAAVQPNPTQTQINLQLRMTNNSDYDDTLSGGDISLLNGDAAFQPLDWLDSCSILVAGAAAKDDCRLSFLVPGLPLSMTLRLQAQGGETLIPITLGGPLPAAAAKPTPPGGRLTVQTPTGEWPVGTQTYRIVSAKAESYDATRTAILLQLAMTNNGQSGDNLWGRSVRLIEDSIPRSPEDSWSQSCNLVVDPGATSDQCQLEFVVPISASNLQLRFSDAGQNTETFVPLPSNRAVP